MAEKNIFWLVDVGKSIQTKNKKKEILKGINLQIKQQEFVCIMGPTGCGKSTLMRLLAGIDRCDEGILKFEVEQETAIRSKKQFRDVGVAYQSDNLFEWLTVEKNIRQPIDVFGLEKELEGKKRVNEMLQLTGLTNYRDCYPCELSGGMRQRCAFGRALAHDPEVLLLDQPFGALDAITRKILGTELLKIWKQEHKTVVMVTNSVPEALMLANRIVVLSQAPAEITEILDNPLSYEERLGNLQESQIYVELSERLNQLVHSERR